MLTLYTGVYSQCLVWSTGITSVPTSLYLPQSLMGTVHSQGSFALTPLWKDPQVLVSKVLGLAQIYQADTLNINYTVKQQTKILTELSVRNIRKVLVRLISQNTNVQIIKSTRNQYKAKLQKINVKHTKKRFKEEETRMSKDKDVQVH